MWARYLLSRSSSGDHRLFGALVAVVAANHCTKPSPIIATAAEFQKSKQNDDNNAKCYSYGCVLLPRDVFYDARSHEALTQLRSTSSNPEVQAKARRELSGSGNDDMATLTLIGSKGDTGGDVNQDRAFCISPFMKKDNWRLLGVFDGHARNGHFVSEHTLQQFPKRLAENLQKKVDPTASEETRTRQTCQCLTDTFLEVNLTAPAGGGCTASVILQCNDRLFVANAGDSRSFISIYDSSTNQTHVVSISREDKPDLPDEQARIVKMGGRVYQPMYGGVPRVMYFDSTTGSNSGLAMSRAIGDHDATGVIANPILQVLDLNELVESRKFSDTEDGVHIFAVSASDGMMDYITPDVIADVVGRALFRKTDHNDKDHPLTACERLIGLAAELWDRERHGRYRDDIAITVSKIRTPSSKDMK